MSTIQSEQVPEYDTRVFILKKDNNYGLGRTCLVKSWKVITPDNVGVKIIIDGIELKIPDSEEKDLSNHLILDGRSFDLPVIINYLRSIIPMSEEENNLCLIEASIFSAQMSATSYYNYFPLSIFNSLLFTGNMYTHFIPYDITTGRYLFPEQIDIEEVFVKPKVTVENEKKFLKEHQEK